MPDLPADLRARIARLSERGDGEAEAGRYAGALTLYREALGLVPEPRADHEVTLWLYAAIADALFLGGDHAAAAEVLDRAMALPDAAGNPFLHLRRGQAAYERGDEPRAADELARAYALAGAGFFDGQDPKYLRFVGRHLGL